ncbi:DUF6118 family protein [Brevundimonas sp.]|uniref:DUF6118 family protein n=1 Tax=Brevundimonas sp. TaxID=1871086 RepID=UPI0028A21570|nr:DUF6118 family protein [Brevundimonas sp.]
MAEEQAGDPTQAFEDLRAEVSVLRRAIEGLPAAIRDHRPPDYSQDLAILGKGLDEIGQSLETVLASPALNLTPEQQGQGIARAGSALVREAAQRLDRAAQEAERERSRLSGLIGQAWARDRQARLLWWAGGVAFAVGLLLSPILASVAPFGLNTRVAALVMREDRWTAGGELMRAAKPASCDRVIADMRLADDNRDAIEACRAASVESGKMQRCTVVLAAPRVGVGEGAVKAIVEDGVGSDRSS